MSSIRLHPDHGLNPTIPVCLWCGQPKNEVALLGAKYRGQAPVMMILDYMPCQNCKAQMEQGITCVEVDGAQKLGRPPFQREGALAQIAPTGRWVVIRDDSVDRLPFKPEQIDHVRKARRALIDAQAFDLLFGPRMEAQEHAENAEDRDVRDQASQADADLGGPAGGLSPAA